jgi:Uma2 family endonuclease
MSTAPDKVEPPDESTYGEPAWGVATLYPAQGCWTERDYLDLDTNHLVEYSNGYVEFLPKPTLSHQLIAFFLLEALKAFVKAQGLGTVVGAAYKVRLWEEKYREPDVIFVRSEHASWLEEEFSDGADLVMEVVSRAASDRHRDLMKKRREYAQAGIPEYWIVDPADDRITVLALKGSEYVEHGVFARGQRATSRLLPGFEVDVTEALTQKP